MRYGFSREPIRSRKSLLHDGQVAVKPAELGADCKTPFVEEAPTDFATGRGCCDLEQIALGQRIVDGHIGGRRCIDNAPPAEPIKFCHGTQSVDVVNYGQSTETCVIVERLHLLSR